MKTIYLYLMETMADWEIGHITAELNSKRFFRKDAPEIIFKTIANTREPIHTMGGLTVLPDCTLEEMILDMSTVLILPGSNEWHQPEHIVAISKAMELLDLGGLVCGICGATVALAACGLLDQRPHTSNGAGFLEMMCPDYKGSQYYLDEPAIRDGNLITASATGGITMAKLILEYLDVFNEDTLHHWHNYFSTGDAASFFSMMQSLSD